MKNEQTDYFFKNNVLNSKLDSVLICIPTYNECENITKIIPAVLNSLPHCNILIIDDNSPDGTGNLADKIAKTDLRVNVLHRQTKEGLGKAYLAGFSWAIEKEYSFIIEFDADFSHNPSYLPNMVSLLQKNDVVVGSRRIKGGKTENWSITRKLLSFAGSKYARTILGVSIRDLTGGFNGFKLSALKKIDLNSISTAGYGFQIELKYKAILAGLKIIEMPIIFPDRKEGTSKMSSAIFIEAMLSVIKLRLKR